MNNVSLEFAPLEGRTLIAAPERYTQGTTMLCVTRSEEAIGGIENQTAPRWHVEAYGVMQDGREVHSHVFTSKTQAEVRAWFAGNRWNPGGPISRPVDWIERKRKVPA